MKKEILDSTLRDGMQSEEIFFSNDDKLDIIRLLDKLGISYIEVGNPAVGEKEKNVFTLSKKINLTNSKLVAFGSTRRKDEKVDEDINVTALLEANTDFVSVFGKFSSLHVEKILHTSKQENLLMIEETCKFLKSKGKTVFFDAEHFFDGYKYDKEFCLECVKATIKGNADVLVMCDTNGGTLSLELMDIINSIKKEFRGVKLGIHAHNDSDEAVANSVLASQLGIDHIQGTLLGFGERCGNANLSSVIANLQLKLGYDCIPENSMKLLTSISGSIAEIANIYVPKNKPYVGFGAFAHKAGMHADAVIKLNSSFEHINPEDVGNDRRLLLSEISGRTILLNKISKIKRGLSKNSPQVMAILNNVKALESKGYKFDGADASFELLVRKHIGGYPSFFSLINYKILEACSSLESSLATAVVKIKVSGKETIVATEGQGPINALDIALRSSLSEFYPELTNMHLIDYKVRVLSREATKSVVRVIITSTDGTKTWSTVGVSHDIVKASLTALLDSIEYKLLQDSL